MNYRNQKMTGKKGKSGRKARIDGKKMKAVSLYIPMEEIDIAPYGKSARYQWIPEVWFRKFKRYFGVRWQDKVRWAMMEMVKQHQQDKLWKCNCANDLLRWHKPSIAFCPQCNYEPTPYERHKSYAEIKKHEVIPVAQKPIKLCTTCKHPYTVTEGKYGKTYTCEKCFPKGLKL
jgi:hypothetical protein